MFRLRRFLVAAVATAVAIMFVVMLSTAIVIVAIRPGLSQMIPPQPIKMKMQRTCLACPNYTITLMSDGQLMYEGADYTRLQGVRTTIVGVATATDLLTEFTQSEFFELENIYASPGSARMTVSISIEMNGVTKAVLSEDRYGPVLLLQLERKMDDLPGMRSLSGWPH